MFNFDNLVSLESYNSYTFLYNLQVKNIVVNYIYIHTHIMSLIFILYNFHFVFMFNLRL